VTLSPERKSVIDAAVTEERIGLAAWTKRNYLEMHRP
jgi:hypothetical protein